MKTKLTMIIFITALFCAEAQEYTWSEDQLSYAREGLSATTLDDSLFFSGGREYNLNFKNTVDIYDVSENHWESVDLESQDRFYSVAVSCNGKVFLAGGINLPNPIINCNDVDIYDKNTEQWTIEYLSQGRHFIGAVANGNKVYFAGGMHYDGSYNYHNVIDVYDTEDESWATPLSLTEPKGGVGVAAVGSKVFFAGGGVAPNTHSDLVEIYDVITGEWTYDNLSQARTLPATVAYGNRVYFAGGMLPNSFSSDVVDIYNVETGEWDSIQTLSSPRIARALKVKDALIFVGETDYISTSGTYGMANGIVDIYYPETGQWDFSVPDLDPARIMYGCTAYDDKAYFAGGYPGGSSLSDLVSILQYHDTHCLPDGITFTTQEEINNFQSNYPYCSEIGGNVEISGTNILHLDSLHVITYVKGDLSIINCEYLSSIQGLQNLTAIEGKLEIINNDNLISLSGLDNIDIGSITDLKIYDNSSLYICDAPSICDYLGNTAATFEIHDNEPGCNNKIQIQAACLITSVEELSVDHTFTISPSPFSGSVTLRFSNNEKGLMILDLFGISGEKIKRLINEEKLPGTYEVTFNLSDLKPGIYFCTLKTSYGIQTKKIVKL